jgi:hypothetical protein
MSSLMVMVWERGVGSCICIGRGGCTMNFDDDDDDDDVYDHDFFPVDSRSCVKLASLVCLCASCLLSFC